MAENTQGIGKSMLAAAWVLALLLLTWLFNGGLDSGTPQPATRRDGQGRVEVVLTRNPYGHYVSAGMINGQPVEFMVDTGASLVVVPQAMVAQLNLTTGPAFTATTASDTVTFYATRLDSVRIGDIELLDVRAGINPYAENQEVLLGMSFLRYLEFSQQGNELRLRYP